MHNTPIPKLLQDSIEMTELSHDFTSCYEQYFRVLKADTPNLLDEVYQLRYQVYCVENSFEEPAEHLDGRERDEYDERSTHILLVHRESDAAIGTARIILPTHDDGSPPLPIQRILAPGDREAFERLPLRRIAEISRFAIGKQLRPRWQSKSAFRAALSSLSQQLQASEKLLTRYVTFGLLRGILDICTEHAILYIAAVMEPALIRALVRFGLDFEPVGGRVDHHGIRQPCVAHLADLVERVRGRRNPLWQYLAVASGSASRQAMMSS